MKKLTGLLSLCILILLAACTTPATPAATPIPETPSPLPPTWTPLPEPTATPTPTATPFQPFEAKALTDYLNLRSNPGYLFTVLTMLEKDTPFQVLGKSPGGEWIYVELEDGKTGWIFAQLIASDIDLQLAPVREPEDTQLITGSVADSAGEPISGIQFTIQGASSSAFRTDAMTDQTGVFYAYLPSGLTGKWYVSYTAIACTSNRMDKDCNCLNDICGSISTELESVTLPQAEPLEFLWE